MTILIVGATGATGSLVVKQLLETGHNIKIIVRNDNKLSSSLIENEHLTIIKEEISNLNYKEFIPYVRDCDVVISCLGHELSLKGIYGNPRKLVVQTIEKLCLALQEYKDDRKVKFILMNTTGNRNLDLDEKISFSQKCVLSLIRLLLPPHVDNEAAANFLRLNIGQNDSLIQWLAVRPDGLINKDEVSEYELYDSPTRSAIFDAGQTSRINVAHFIVSLVEDDKLWNKWKGKMPVIYNKEEK